MQDSTSADVVVLDLWCLRQSLGDHDQESSYFLVLPFATDMDVVEVVVAPC